MRTWKVPLFSVLLSSLLFFGDAFFFFSKIILRQTVTLRQRQTLGIQEDTLQGRLFVWLMDFHSIKNYMKICYSFYFTALNVNDIKFDYGLSKLPVDV